MGIQEQQRALLEELRARMADLRPESIEQTMRLAGIMHKSVRRRDSALLKEVQGYLRTLGRRYRDWKRQGLLPG